MMNVPFLSWKALTLGKLTDMLSLVTRVEGTEDYVIFNADRMEEAKALFVWACGNWISKPSREDFHNRVMELTLSGAGHFPSAQRPARRPGTCRSPRGGRPPLLGADSPSS